MTTDSPSETGSAAQPSRAFEADVARLLHLMVHSVYSDRAIFVRELVSNGADACEKLRYEALSNPSLVQEGASFLITVSADKDAKTLTFADNGIGMTEAEMVAALGTIASSGTRAFMESLKDQEAKAAPELIGQFGIGFYSSFMVADKVDVYSRKAGTTVASHWSSDGKGSYTVSPCALEEAPAQGSRVVLHMSETAAEFLEPWRIESIIREHSGAVAIPIDFVEAPGKEPRRLGEGTALWVKPKASVTPEDYKDFYQALAGQFDEPALTAHWRAEGRHEYHALAFVPGSRPLDLFDPARKSRAKLYVRRVLIDADAHILPGWLRFVKAVVDSSDLPLNVSREMIQESQVFAAIRKGVTSHIVADLTRLAEHEPENYAKIWDNFGAVIKEGLYEDYERRDALLKLARFTTSSHGDTKRSLADYVANLRENQTAIWYLAGDDLKRLRASPQLEGFSARGIEVLLLPDPVDAFWVQSVTGYDGKPFKSVTQGAADIKTVPLLDGDVKDEAPVSEAVAALMSRMKEVLNDAVSDVRVSDRLSNSAACLVAKDQGPDRRLERMLAEHGQLPEVTKPVLEINPRHALLAKLAASQDATLVEDAIWLILDDARLADGERPDDSAAFAARLARVIERAADGVRG